MRKTIIVYGLALAIAAFLLEWLQYKYVVRAYATEIYIFLIAVAFTALGVFAGRRLTERTPPGAFQKNVAALASLGVTDREYEVLTLLAEGCANKEIARRLDLSPNTVKTHIARLFEKLEAQRRTQAVQKARELALIP
jgi:DNA-binding CsgD family transcriptional regulator